MEVEVVEDSAAPRSLHVRVASRLRPSLPKTRWCFEGHKPRFRKRVRQSRGATKATASHLIRADTVPR